MKNNGINIKPDREYFRTIVEYIDTGKFAVPIFQRDFVWNRSQILDLFDSIIKGYPIGTILLWRPPQEPPFGYKDIITDKKLDVPNSEYCILDGRQRLTAFYGCVTEKGKGNDDFGLYYDLEKEILTYSFSPKKKWLWSLREIYDTYSLIKKSQSLLDEPDYDELFGRASRLNKILNDYVVGEIIMNDGSLEDAQMAFTRLNSKGTPISNWDMHQALSYSEGEDRTLNEMLNEIRQSLYDYGFQDIKEDEVLACCYKYAGHRYLEKIDELEKVDVKPYIQSVGQDLVLATHFLHDYCFIFSPKLFPYAKQIVPISYFFKLNPNPSEEQKREMARWIFYTIYTQQLSGSLSTLRLIFNRFDEFAEGRKLLACDEYQEVPTPQLGFSFSTGTAKSDFLLVSMIRHRLRNESPQGMSFLGNYTFVTNTPAGVMPIVDKGDYRMLHDSLHNNITFDYWPYCLNEELVRLLRDKKYDRFISIRADLLCQIEISFLHDYGIDTK